MLPRTCSGELYNILQLSRDCTNDDIRRQYRRLAIQYHPDKTNGQTTEQFKAIEEAHRILSDSNTRQLYNLFGRTGLTYLGDTGLPNVVQSIAVIKGVVLLTGLVLGALLASVILFCYKVDHPVFGLSWGLIFLPVWMMIPMFVLAAVLSLLSAARECHLKEFFTFVQLILIACTLTAFAITLFQRRWIDDEAEYPNYHFEHYTSKVRSLSSFTIFIALAMATYVVTMIKHLSTLTPSAFAASHADTYGSMLQEDGYTRVDNGVNTNSDNEVHNVNAYSNDHPESLHPTSRKEELHINNSNNNNNNNNNHNDNTAEYRTPLHYRNANVLSPRARAWIVYCLYVISFVFDKTCVIAFFTLAIIRTRQMVQHNAKPTEQTSISSFTEYRENYYRNNDANIRPVEEINDNVQIVNEQWEREMEKRLLSFWIIFAPLILKYVVRMVADMLLACYSVKPSNKAQYMNITNTHVNPANDYSVNDINVEIEADNDLGPFDRRTNANLTNRNPISPITTTTTTALLQQQEQEQQEQEHEAFTTYLMNEIKVSLCDRASAALLSCVVYIFPLYMLLMWSSKCNYLLNGDWNSYNPSALVATLPLVLLLGLLTLIPCCLICVLAEMSTEEVFESYMSNESPDLTRTEAEPHNQHQHNTTKSNNNINNNNKNNLSPVRDNKETMPYHNTHSSNSNATTGSVTPANKVNVNNHNKEQGANSFVTQTENKQNNLIINLASKQQVNDKKNITTPANVSEVDEIEAGKLKKK